MPGYSVSNKNQKYKQILCLNVGMDLAFSARGKLSSLFGAVASFVLASVSAIKGKSTAASFFFQKRKREGFSSLRSQNPYFALMVKLWGKNENNCQLYHFFIGVEK